MGAEDSPSHAAVAIPEHERVPPIYNRFLFVDIAALRAKQLRRGALPRLDPPVTDPATGHRSELPHKAKRIAMEEVRTGLVPFEVIGRTPVMEADA